MSLSSLSLCMVRMMSWVKLCVEKRDVINMKWEDIHGRMEKDDTTCDGCKHVSALILCVSPRNRGDWGGKSESVFEE